MEYSKKSYKIVRNLQTHLIIRAKEFARNIDLFERFSSLINDDDEDFDRFIEDFVNTVFSEELHGKLKSELLKLKEFENVDVDKLHEHLNESVYIDLRLIKQMLYEYDKQKREKGA